MLQYFYSCLVCLVTDNTQLRCGLVLKVHSVDPIR